MDWAELSRGFSPVGRPARSWKVRRHTGPERRSEGGLANSKTTLRRDRPWALAGQTNYWIELAGTSDKAGYFSCRQVAGTSLARTRIAVRLSNQDRSF
jgi:hypothetical protein